MSTSVHTTMRPRAACVPALRAEPVPRFFANRISRIPSICWRSSPEPSVEPSSITMSSNEYGDCSSAVRTRSISRARCPRSLWTGRITETSSSASLT